MNTSKKIAITIVVIFAIAAGALAGEAPVLESALTLIEDGRLYYRGRDACELSRTATLEQVAALLWTGDSEEAAGLTQVW